MAIIMFFLVSAAFAQTTPPIRIGATVSLSGKYSEPSAMIREGYRLWEQQVNQRGGMLGRPVELLLYDDRSDPETTHDLYQKLVFGDRVDLLLSPYGTPLTLQASQVSESQRMVMLACAASGKDIWTRGYEYVFGMYALADRYFIGMLDLMARQGIDSVAVLHEDSPFTIDVADGVERWSKRFGISLSLKQSFEPGQEQLEQLLRNAAQRNVRALILAVYPPAGYRSLGLMQRIDWRPDALGMTIAPIHPDFYRNAGPIAESIFGPSQWEPDERIPFPGTTKFVRDFKATFNRLPSYHAGSAYASCQILESAVTELNDIDHRRIRGYISSLDTVTVIGRFKVDHLGRQVGHNPILVQWQDGKKEIVYPTKMKTAEP
ncbi:MAG TPA: amino acid ABC transporter substrate-binding protein, partial [Desulfosarcina sp.]|nr:amino acid ABC transporter substrate-binding protein [Desulfosarcina sp.]